MKDLECLLLGLSENNVYSKCRFWFYDKIGAKLLNEHLPAKAEKGY